MQVMSHPGVDYTRTVSNHIIDIIDVLGIEAARAALLKVCFPCILAHRLALVTQAQACMGRVPHSRWYAEKVIYILLLSNPSTVGPCNADPSIANYDQSAQL